MHSLSTPRETEPTRYAEEVIMTTSKKDASAAGRLLANPSTPKKVKSVAGSDLAQAKGTSKKKK